jgi:hypothetical protein
MGRRRIRHSQRYGLPDDTRGWWEEGGEVEIGNDNTVRLRKNRSGAREAGKYYRRPDFVPRLGSGRTASSSDDSMTGKDVWVYVGATETCSMHRQDLAY